MSEQDQPQGLDDDARPARPAPPARPIPEFAQPPLPEDRAPEYIELDFGAEEESKSGFGAKFGIKRRERTPVAELPPRTSDPFDDSLPDADDEPEVTLEPPAPLEVASVEELEPAPTADGWEEPAPLAVAPGEEPFSMRRGAEEENVLIGDIDQPEEVELPPHGLDPFAPQLGDDPSGATEADYVDTEAPAGVAMRPAPPEIIDATATAEERTGNAWERQVAPPEVVDASPDEVPAAKKKSRSLLGRRRVKQIEPVSEEATPGALAICPLHDVPLAAPLLFNENTGARYPAGTTHAVCIGVLPAPAPVAYEAEEPLQPPRREKTKRPKREKREKAGKAERPAKVQRPSWRERRAAANEQKRTEAQDTLLSGLLVEQKLSWRERRQQAKRHRQLEANARKTTAVEPQAAPEPPEEPLPPFEAPLDMSQRSDEPFEPLVERPVETFADPLAAKKEKKAKKERPAKVKKGKPVKVKAVKVKAEKKRPKEKRERRSLLSLLGIKRIEALESPVVGPSPWDEPAPVGFIPPVVEPVSEEPPQSSIAPLVIDSEDEEPLLPPLLPALRRQPALPPVVDPIELDTSESMVFDASRPDEEIARAQEKSQRRRGWRSRRERPTQPKAAPLGTHAAGQEWRQRILAREARPFLLLLLAAFLLLISMWVLAVRGSAEAPTPVSAEGQSLQPQPAPGEAEVPDVVGQTLEAARLVLDSSSFLVDVKQEQSPRPEGEIIAQDPAPAATAALGSPVTVTVSAGQGQVPNVVGQNVEAALGRIEGAGFEVERRARIDREQVGKVIEQQPKPGTRAGKGSVVVVFFGRAPAAAPLPNVVGQTQSEARAVLADKGYGVRIRYSYAVSPTGDVIKSTPAAGKKLSTGDTVTLTVSLGPRTKSTAPTPSPASVQNGEVAYVVAAAGNGEIYLSEADGSGRENLSNHPGDDRNPTFAPTGLQLAFQSDRAGNFDIYSRPTSGQGVRRLTTAANDEREPAWSPQGQRIAYVSKEGDFYALYTMATDGSGKTKVLGGQRSWRTPSWSPDGQRLLVAGGNADDSNIFVVAASGGTPRQVAGAADYDVEPTFSPNSQRVLFSSNRDGDYDLYSVALSGGGATRLTSAAGDDMNPSYSPDGKRIVFQSTRQGAVAVYHMPAAGGSAQRVAPGQAPSWQPSSS